MKKENKLVFIAKDGYPVEGFVGKPIKTWIRRILLTRKIMRYKDWLKETGIKIEFES